MNNALNNTDATVAIERITPEIAAKYLERNIKNRSKKERSIGFYSKLMNNNEWIFNGESSQFDVNGDLVNGQHRLISIVRTGITADIVVVRNVPEQAKTTYDQQDRRSVADIFEIESIKYATTKAGILNKFFLLRANKEGGSNVKYSIRKKYISKAELLTEYLIHQELFDEITELTTECYQKQDILVPSFYGAYMALLILEKGHEKEKVYEYFKKLACIVESNFDCIINVRSRLYKSRHNPNRRLTNAYIHAYLVQGWNAFIRNRDCKISDYNDTHGVPQFLSREDIHEKERQRREKS